MDVLKERRKTVAVTVGGVTIGGRAPVVVQSMTNTDTADIDATAHQTLQLIEAGSELVRITVNTRAAAEAVPRIVERVRAEGHDTPLVGDFHYNGHMLLAEHPDMAEALDKYRINPGNVGPGEAGDAHFTAMCRVAAANGKAVRIGVNAGSLNEELLGRRMAENRALPDPAPPDAVLNACMIESALQSTELAVKAGLGRDRIVLSCKTSSPPDLIAIYRELADRSEQPLHLGLTEAGMGAKGLVWSSASMAVLLAEGIGDTVRISLTPRPGGDRREEVYASCELLQALGLRRFSPSVTACPGCGRTSGAVFQELAEQVERHIRARMPEWRRTAPGVEAMTVAVMGCTVNGPGESRAADIGISLPCKGETPRCPVYVDGEKATELTGNGGELAEAFTRMIDEYAARRFGGSAQAARP